MHRHFLTLPKWVILLATGGGSLALVALLLNRFSLPASFQVNTSVPQTELGVASSEFDLGPRHQLTYKQWVDLLQREARVAADQRPKRLTILAGDSLSLWFPQELLPVGFTWLNQGISGETSYGLLRRLKLFDATHPDTIFIMIGINDLIRGVREETLLANQREIVRHLKVAHPHAQIVVQSILPHGGTLLLDEQYRRAVQRNQQPPPWVDRLYLIPNHYIRELNKHLAAIARQEKVEYLDLHTHFTNEKGDMRPDLTTDGLHLSSQGYKVWRSQLELFFKAEMRGKG
ncbi:SGNH/GDSL hydrolase family protein [Leptothermofonsia sp. ETS-13]|uniref:SGNH/GDSL hydrolase family protein n=1 Tax=Leptothermofonsia sp. ETS-13 TaxID=3035696 RepID=UPI003BA2EDBA